MLFTHPLSLLLALAPLVAPQQIVFDSIHNATSIVGTWSSGSKHVVTGPVRFTVMLSITNLIHFSGFCEPH